MLVPLPGIPLFAWQAPEELSNQTACSKSHVHCEVRDITSLGLSLLTCTMGKYSTSSF